MQKETVIATVRAEMGLSEALQAFLSQFSDRENAWFARNSGELLLAEFGYEWNNNFVEVAQSVFDGYFRELGLPEDSRPRVILTDSRRGSWIMEAALTMFGTIGTTYTILKALAELPKLADGLEETKKRLQKELTARFKKKVPERIEPVLRTVSPPIPLPPPAHLNRITINCTIDARPLRGLTPDFAKSHAIHLSVAVSRSALSVENLGKLPIENLRIGLFKSASQRHSWSFGDAFSKSIPRISGGQSTSISIDQFASGSDSSKLDLADPTPLYVDCWLQDNSGIYIFNFYLE
jgi:hypothetical protein